MKVVYMMSAHAGKRRPLTLETRIQLQSMTANIIIIVAASKHTPFRPLLLRVVQHRERLAGRRLQPIVRRIHDAVGFDDMERVRVAAGRRAVDLAAVHRRTVDEDQRTGGHRNGGETGRRIDGVGSIVDHLAFGRLGVGVAEVSVWAGVTYKLPTKCVTYFNIFGRFILSDLFNICFLTLGCSNAAIRR